jgi:hypothetical protein
MISMGKAITIILIAMHQVSSTNNILPASVRVASPQKEVKALQTLKRKQVKNRRTTNENSRNLDHDSFLIDIIPQIYLSICMSMKA